MKTHSASVRICAPPQQIWGVLVDFAQYPRWNTVITRASGVLQPGSRLDLYLCLGNGARPFAPMVTAVHPPRELHLSRSFLHPWLLHATHAFRIEQIDEHSARLTQSWKLSGLLSGLLWPKFREGLPAFERMNQEIAHEVERRLTYA